MDYILVKVKDDPMFEYNYFIMSATYTISVYLATHTHIYVHKCVHTYAKFSSPLSSFICLFPPLSPFFSFPFLALPPHLTPKSTLNSFLLSHFKPYILSLFNFPSLPLPSSSRHMFLPFFLMSHFPINMSAKA